MKTVVDKRKEDCCGCGACEAICPLDAIRLVLDRDGFYYPRVETDKCIECGKCVQVCNFVPEMTESRKGDGN